MKQFHSHIIRVLVLSLLLVLGTNCEKEKISPRDFPGLRTLEVDQISEKGASFHAELIERGDFGILQYGFVWSRTSAPNLDYSDKIIITGGLTSTSFSAEITTTLEEGIIYYVRSFIQTDAYTVYGNIQEFLSLGSAGPAIASVNPLAGTIGDTIVIRGEDFSFNNSNNRVLFDEIEAKVSFYSDTLIRAVVPVLEKASYDISVEVVGNRSTFDQPFELSQPEIISFYPAQLAIDDTLTISGSGFSYSTESNELKIGGVTTKVLYSDKETLRAIIPSGLAAQNSIDLVLAGKEASAPELLEFLEPAISLVSPQSVIFGDSIHIWGENFSFIKANNQLSLNGLQVIPVSASKTKISFILPDEISESQLVLTCQVAGRMLTYEGIAVKEPVLNTVSPDLIENTDVQELVLRGENFSKVVQNNSVIIGGLSAQVLSATYEELTVAFPARLIPDPFVSLNDTFDIQLQVLDQSFLLEDGLLIDYQSRWTRKSNFPGPPRDLPASFSYQGKGYYGLGSADSYDTHYTDFWEYDPDTDTWTALTPFPGPGRVWATYFTIGDKFYVCCGAMYTYTAPDTKLQDVWEYDIVSDSWTQKNDFPGGLRMRAYGFSLNGSGYLGGGQAEDWIHQTDLWEYQPLTDTWVQKADPPIHPSASYETYAVTHSEKAYVIGMYSDGERYFWTYDPDPDSWTRAANKPLNYMEPTTFSLGEYLYYGFGGSYYSGSSFFRYSPSDDLWEGLGFTGTPSRTYAAGFATGEKAYIIGGIGSGFHSNLVDVWEFDPAPSVLDP